MKRTYLDDLSLADLIALRLYCYDQIPRPDSDREAYGNCANQCTLRIEKIIKNINNE